MPPRPAGGAPMSQDDINQLMLQMAQSSQQLTAAVASLTSSQSSFMRSAADADANIGLSKAHSLLNVELIAAQQIDNTVSNLNRLELLESAGFWVDSGLSLPARAGYDVRADVMR